MSQLESLIRNFKLDWMIDGYVPRAAAVPALTAALYAADSESTRRFGPSALPITVEALQAEVEPHPYRVEAFLQALAATSTPAMLVLVWRILSGWEIAHVSLQFNCCKSFSLEVVLREDGSGPEEKYRSDDIADAALLRHFGIARKNDQPYFDGFYALHLFR